MSEAAQPEEYVVSKNLCIDCNACYTTFPEIFKQVPWEGETKAEAYNKTTVGKYNPWDIVGVCPTDAISKIGEMPAKAEGGADNDIAPLEDLGPWEERWAAHKNQTDSKWEVMKRYGMAATITEKKDRYFIKVEFPATTPNHITKFKMGLPDTMPDYDWKAELNADSNELIVDGQMTDPHIQKLCGKINSFPDRFRRSFRFEHKVDVLRKAYRNKILSIELKKITAAEIH